MNETRHVKTLIATMILSAVTAAVYAGSSSHAIHPYLAAEVLALAAITSRMKVKLPGVNGNMSVNLPFLLIAVVNLSAVEAIVVTAVSTAVQCWPKEKSKFNPQQMAFNLSMMTFASCLASIIFHSSWLSTMAWTSNSVMLVLATATLFLGQTVPVASIVAISDHKTVGPIWWNVAQLSFPYYVVSAGISSMLAAVSSHLGWELALAVFPVMYGIHRSYKLYFGRIAESSAPILVRAAGVGA